MSGNNEQITKFIKTTKRRNRGVFHWLKKNPAYEKRDFICYLKTSLKTAEF